jgi:hypothetical protein
MALFRGQSLEKYLEFQVFKMAHEVEAMSDDQIANTPMDTLVSYLVEKYDVKTPMLIEGQMVVEEPGSKRYVNVSGINVEIPFEGDKELFDSSPRTSPMLSEHFHASAGRLKMHYGVQKDRIDLFEGELKRDIQRINECLKGIEERIVHYRNDLPQNATAQVEKQREFVQKHRSFVENLGKVIPIQRRNDGREAVIVPLQRKQIPVLPLPQKPGAQEEPQITIAAYEDILKVMSSMVKVFERSPSVFREMAEEDLRTILLVALNGLYEGRATGETFNGAGKNDILIREADRNVFIAECLMWEGPEYLKGKLDDQLFKYATWRDSKLAVLIFNRKKNFAAVTQKMRDVCEKHPQKVGILPYHHETGARYMFRRADDPQKTFTLTALAFEVPS